MWLEFTGAALSVILIFAIVGIPLAAAVGMRGFWLFAVAPAFAVTIIGGSAIVAPVLGWTWSLAPVLACTVVLGASLAAIQYAVRRTREATPHVFRLDFWLLAALLLAGILIAGRVLAIIGTPEAISQTFDNVFHLNGVRFILDTGNASSLWIGRMTNPGGEVGFYPAAWHAIVALVIQISGASIPVAVNALTLVVSAIVWPLGVILLTRTLFGRSAVLVMTAGLLAASLPIFPLLLMDYGVLYPYQLGVAALPAVLALTLRALDLGRDRTGRVHWWAMVAVAGALPGLVFAHPGAFVAWLALATPMVIVFAIVRIRASSSAVYRIFCVLSAGAYLFVVYQLFLVLRPPVEARQWPLQLRLREAAWEVISVAPWYHVSALLPALAVLSGIIWICVTRSRAGLVALGMYAVAAFLFVNVAAMPNPEVRDFFTGPWYNNLPRLAPLLAIVMVPIGAYGVAGLSALVRANSAVSSKLSAWPHALRGGLVLTISLIAAIFMQFGPATPLPTAQAWANWSYSTEVNPALLSKDEAALLARLDEIVPEGTAVVGSAWTGASLAFALADRPVLMPHLLMDVSDDVETVNDGLSSAVAGGEVCAALDRLDAGFVLDFGAQEVHSGEHIYSGLSNLENSDAVRLVDEEGEARLYEIVACAA